MIAEQFDDPRHGLDGPGGGTGGAHLFGDIVVAPALDDVIPSALFVVGEGMGADGGDKGGQIVVAGTPETVAACEASWTGKYLAPLLAASPRAVEEETAAPVKRARKAKA